MTTRDRSIASAVASPPPEGSIRRRCFGLVPVKARSYERLIATVVWKVISRLRQS